MGYGTVPLAHIDENHGRTSYHDFQQQCRSYCKYMVNHATVEEIAAWVAQEQVRQQRHRQFDSLEARKAFIETLADMYLESLNRLDIELRRIQRAMGDD